MLGPLCMLCVYLSCALLHVSIPVRQPTSGYCCDQTNFRPLIYRLNGLLVLVAVLCIFLFALPSVVLEQLWTDYWHSLIGANILGIGLSLAVFINGGSEKYQRCLTVDQIENGKPKLGTALANGKPNALTRFFLGCKWNPRVLGIDCKMYLYVAGAVGLACNVSACVVMHKKLSGGYISNAMIVYTALFFWFIAEYMFYEHVHIYTYDLFAEKVGFKLIWGCLVFYPYFYAIGCYSLVNTTPESDISLVTCCFIAALFFCGWIITRGANLQKYEYRINPKRDVFRFLFGIITVNQRTLPSSRLLISGWWGIARHFNYFGEIVQGLALAIPGYLVTAGGSSVLYRLIPFLYPLYYIILFVTREIDDDALCKAKYGKQWDDYCAVVSWRICPGVW